MFIKQEENSPISDLFYGLHVYEALNLIKDTSDTLCVDTDILKESCLAAQEILKNYLKKIEELERKVEKQNAKSKVMSKIYAMSDY